MNEKFLADLMAREEIKALKYRYLRCLDTKDWDGFEQCFVPDATGAYGGLDFDDRDGILNYMRTSVTDGVITLHQVHHPEIEISGDSATGRWYLQDKVQVPAFNYVLEGAAFYSDRYRLTPEGWRIEHTGYARTHEATYSTKDLPSYRLKIKPTH